MASLTIQRFLFVIEHNVPVFSFMASRFGSCLETPSTFQDLKLFSQIFVWCFLRSFWCQPYAPSHTPRWQPANHIREVHKHQSSLFWFTFWLRLLPTVWPWPPGKISNDSSYIRKLSLAVINSFTWSIQNGVPYTFAMRRRWTASISLSLAWAQFLAYGSHSANRNLVNSIAICFPRSAFS